MKRHLGAIAAAIVLVLGVTGCGDDGGDSGSAAADDGSTTTGANEPVAGGTLTVGVFAEVASLDPILSGGTGFTGGSEQAAIFDQLVVYDSESETYVPQTAEALTPNADHTEWTLKLRPDITFSDGTPYDAEAVKLNVERHASPKSQSQFRGVVATDITDITVVDSRTVTFSLAAPWPGFPVVLASAPGRIISPQALEKLGEGISTNPVGAGAGPFVVSSFRPNEALVLKRNPDYWGGDVYLDELRFVFAGDGSATVEALKADGVDVVVLRDAEANARAVEAGYAGIETPIAGANVLQLNSGVMITCNAGQPAPQCTGEADGAKVQAQTPTIDRTVRRAIAAAIDPEVVNERAYRGAGIASTALIPPGFPWDPEVDGPKYDPELAKRLVEEAKSNGWDGTIRVLVQNAGATVPTGDAVETMLRAVGMVVVKDATKDTQQVIRQVFVNNDYDTVTWGYAMTPDDLLYLNLTQNLTGRYGYRSDAMDDALQELRIAATSDQKVAALEKVATVWTDDVPAVALVHFGSYVAWDSNVHDVRTTTGVTALFDKAWIG